MTAPAIHMRRCVVRIYVGVHPPHAAFDNSTAYVCNITATTIPLFRLLQANYSSTILGIQYDDSAVIIHAIPQTPLTILTALMPLNKSIGTLWRFRRNPLTTPQKFFGDFAKILWRFRRWSVDYSRGKTADIVKFLVTCTVCFAKHVYALVFTVFIVHFVILHHYGSHLWLVHCIALTILHKFKLVLYNALFSCCILADVVKCLYLPCAINKVSPVLCPVPPLSSVSLDLIVCLFLHNITPAQQWLKKLGPSRCWSSFLSASLIVVPLCTNWQTVLYLTSLLTFDS